MGSILLTKKALLVGGGGAAAATAVTVPVVVTQKDNSKETDFPLQESSVKWDLNLVMQDKSPFNSFNKPGDCIKKSFPGIENKKVGATENNKLGIFHKPENLEGKTPSIIFGKVNVDNDQNNVTQPENGCLMLNKYKDESNKEFRVELTLKKGIWGYIWMSLLKKREDSDIHDLYVREIITKNQDNTWVGYSALDAKFTEHDKDILPTFDDAHFQGKENRWVLECTDNKNKETCTEKEANVFVWKKRNSGTTFLPSTAEDLSKAILALRDGDNNRSYDNPNTKERLSIFGDSSWFKNVDSQNQPMIAFEKSKVFPDTYKGEWQEIVDFCDTETDGEPFTSFCPQESSSN